MSRPRSEALSPPVPPSGPWPRVLILFLILAGGSLSGEGLRPVRLHLKWYHQFQFAGFYAAQTQGYYREAGLEVALIEAGPGRMPLPAVESGQAEFGVSDAEVLGAYLRGRPLVALGVIFQHSPSVLLAVKGRGILSPADLAGRTVMFQGGQGESEARAMLQAEGLPMERIRVLPHSWRLDDLLEGKVDALSAYSTNEPFLLEAMGAKVVTLRPIAYGVDFYGDTLFTSRAFAEKEAELTEAFRRASFKGWEYAMAHPEELISHILALPGVQARGLTREKLRFEAERMKELLLPGLVDAGHMNPGRFRAMADIMARQEGFTPLQDPEHFGLERPVPAGEAFRRVLRIGGPIAFLLGLVVLLWITQLRHTVHRRTRDLEEEIGHRKRSEEALRESELRLGEILDSVDACIFIKDDRYRYTYVNRKVCELFGLPADAIVGKEDAAFFPEEHLELIARSDRQVIELGESVAREENGFAAAEESPRTYWTVKIPLRDEHGRIYGLCGHAMDITDQRTLEAERRRLEAQLHQTQKLESLGSLAGGIAHDMNNVLGAILGLASAHRQALKAPSPLASALDTIVTAAERGGTLVKGLLHFARQTPGELRRLDLNTLIREEVELLERTTLSRVRLALDLDPHLGPVFGDGSALTHALMNLCVNAVDAMPESGTLTFRTRNLPEGWVEAGVLDTGTGMAPEVLEKALDPFFTTKPEGKGTGLGLSMVYSTVKAHQGTVELRSEVGKGTEVWLRFPPCPRGQSEASQPAHHPHAEPAALRVLVVDDDPLVLESITAMLEILGHEVLSASSGEEALALIAQGSNPDAVLLDLNMPGLGGADTLHRLRALHRDLQVFLATGRADQRAIDLVEADPHSSLLPKPFALGDLKAALQKVIPGGGPAGV